MTDEREDRLHAAACDGAQDDTVAADGDVGEATSMDDLIATLERERDEAVAGRQRALADFANYQRRATENEQRAKLEGMSRVLRSLIPVMDHFDLALEQEPASMTVDQVFAGVAMVRRELDKVFEECGGSRIEVEPGDAFNPGSHEAMLRQPHDDVEPGHVTQQLKVGYALGDLVLRPAQVAVAPDDD